ncbi:hypothetical protein [Legionella fairfieldensis]|uniref:hypothetical protein n=1 Tax=Legionella fairfieldensis TaxID=45064 RepID=UPI000687CA0A|nr:hypothetical protein [Legionella fairfieldensis]
MNFSQDLMAVEQAFRDFLASNGHPLDGEIRYDSNQFHYLKCPHGSSTDARYKFYSDGIISGYCKCWYCDIEKYFCSKQKHEISRQEWKVHRQRMAEEKARIEQETQKRCADAAILAQTVFFSASEMEASKHGYLSLKQVRNHGLRVVKTENEHTNFAQCYKDTLLVPCFNANNELVNLERIYFDKKANKYKKRPLVGGLRNGAYYLIGEHQSNHDVILLAEGTATGFTAYEASGYPVAITFNCNNLINVAKIIREKYPHTKLLIIADDDRWHNEVDLRDTGVKAAKKVCTTVENISYFLPDFKILQLSEERLGILQLTDMNDLFVHLLANGIDNEGALAIIREQILVAISTTDTISHAVILDQLLDKIGKIDFAPLAELREGEKLTNSQMQVIIIDQILILAKNNNWGLCRQYDFLYLFNGEYWYLIEENELKTFLGNAAEKMGLRNVHVQHFNFKEQLYKQFLVAANLSKPEQPKEIINIHLRNGTFEITPTGNVLKPFNRNDFMIYQLPFDYNPQASAPLFFVI